MTPLLCTCAVVITLEMSKKEAPRFVEHNFLTKYGRLKRFSQNEKEGQIYKRVPRIFTFLPQDLVMLFQSSVIMHPIGCFTRLRQIWYIKTAEKQLSLVGNSN